MRIHSWMTAIALALAFTFVSCSDDDDPIGPTEHLSVTATIAGKSFKATNVKTAYSTFNGFGTLYIKADDGSTYLVLAVAGPTSGTNYTLKDTLSAAYGTITSGGKIHASMETNGGTLQLTNFNDVTMDMTGTFEVHAKAADGSTIDAVNGSFKKVIN